MPSLLARGPARSQRSGSQELESVVDRGDQRCFLSDNPCGLGLGWVGEQRAASSLCTCSRASLDRLGKIRGRRVNLYDGFVLKIMTQNREAGSNGREFRITYDTTSNCGLRQPQIPQSRLLHGVNHSCLSSVSLNRVQIDQR